MSWIPVGYKIKSYLKPQHYYNIVLENTAEWDRRFSSLFVCVSPPAGHAAALRLQ